MDVASEHELFRREAGDDALLVITHEIVVGDGLDSGLQKGQKHRSFRSERMGGQSHTVLVYIILLGQPVEHGPAAED